MDIVMTNQEKIMTAIEKHPEGISGAGIYKEAGISSGSLYPILMRLESEKVLRSEWREGPRPRMRLYFKVGA